MLSWRRLVRVLPGHEGGKTPIGAGGRGLGCPLRNADPETVGNPEEIASGSKGAGLLLRLGGANWDLVEGAWPPRCSRVQLEWSHLL